MFVHVGHGAGAAAGADNGPGEAPRSGGGGGLLRPGHPLCSGGFHTLMALLTATGWLAATVFCREYMAHLRKRNRYYLFWLLTLGATMGVFLSGGPVYHLYIF